MSPREKDMEGVAATTSSQQQDDDDKSNNKMAPQATADDDDDGVPREVSTQDKQEDDDATEVTTDGPTWWQRIAKFYWDNEFLILVVLVILLARAYPPLGAEYLYPEITATWIAVIFIFVMAGLALKTEELSKAFQQIRFNIFVQTFNFGIVSVTVYGASRLLVEIGALGQPLADGMVVCASLPLTINMVCVLTKSAGGNEAAAIFNAAFGNMVGVFLSPVLILGYLGLGVSGGVNLAEVFYKLMLRVLVPVVIGQLLQKFSKTVVKFVKQHKPKFKQAQVYTLVFIIYTVFCKTFASDQDSNVEDIFIMIACQFVLLIFFMGVSWGLLGLFFPKYPELRVMGLFGCTHKTVAMGVPLINAIYEKSPYVGQYTLPLLIWHPMQLLLGSFLVPRLLAFVERENERLGINNAESDDNQQDEELAQQGEGETPAEGQTTPGTASASILTGTYHAK